MSAPPPEIYLAEDFDPSTLKVPHLRNILLAYGHGYGTRVTKTKLVEEFYTHVSSQASSQRMTMGKVKASAQGIISVSNDGSETPAVPTKRSRKSKKADQIGVSVLSPIELDSDATTAPERMKTGPDTEPDDDDDPLPQSQPPAKKARGSRAKSTTVGPTPRKSAKPVIQVEDFDQGVQGEIEDSSLKVAATPRKVSGKTPRRSMRAGASLTPAPETRTRASRSSITPGPSLAHEGSSSSITNEGLRTPISAPSKRPIGSARKSEPAIRVMDHVAEAVESEKDDTPEKPHGNKGKGKVSRKSQGDESGFSDFNPFQSGSEHAAEKERRRRKSSIGLPSAPKAKAAKPRFSEPALASSPPGILRRVAPPRESLQTPPSEIKRAMRGQSGTEEYDYDLNAAVAHNHEIQDKFNKISSHEQEYEEQDGDTKVTVWTSHEGAPVEKSLAKRVEEKVEEVVPVPRATIPLSVLFTLLLFFVAHFKGQSSSIGFCDTGAHSNEISVYRQTSRSEAESCYKQRAVLQSEGDHEEAALMQCDHTNYPVIPLLPVPYDCTPCPAHAECHNGEIASCAPEYILSSHPLNFLSPVVDGLPMLGPRVFPPTCKPDTAKKRLIGSLAKTIESSLAQKRGDLTCQGVNAGAGKTDVQRFGIDEEELREKFAEQRDEKFSREAFDEIFEWAVRDLVEHEDLLVSVDPLNDKTTYAASRTELTLTCRAKMEAADLLDRWKSQLGSTAAVLLAIAYIRHTLNKRQAESHLITQLTSSSLTYLQNLETQHHIDPVLTPRSWAPADHVRDKLFPLHVASFPSLASSMVTGGDADKMRIWQRVEEKVEKDSNVLSSTRELGGDHWKTWEWIGVGSIDGPSEQRHVTFQ